LKISLGSLKTERVLACLIQLSKNRLPVWQESNSGFGKCNTGAGDVKVKNANLRISTKQDLRGICLRGPKLTSCRLDAIKGSRFIVARQNCGASDILNEAIWAQRD
jgi:hypothetical protein